MAFKLAEAYVQLSQKGFAQVESHVKGIHAGLGKMKFAMGAVTGAVSAFAASGAVRVFGDFVNAAAEAERQTAKLEAVLKATGGVSGQTVAGLEAMASSLQSVTAFEDDTIKGAQAVLLTFKSIRGDEFRQATEAAMDLATVFEMDLRGAATMVGKALEDPVRGITALRRAGVSFTKDQQEVIKKLVETGEAAKAQALIIKEIQGQVGGSAQAVGNTTYGQLEQLRNEAGDLAELIGGELTPAIKYLVGWLKDVKYQLGGKAALQEDFGNASAALGKRFLNAKTSQEAADAQKAYFDLVKEYRDRGMDMHNRGASGFGSRGFNARIAALRDAEERDSKQYNASKSAGSRGLGIAGSIAGRLAGPGMALADTLGKKLEKESFWLKDQLASTLRQERLLQNIYERLAPRDEAARFAP